MDAKARLEEIVELGRREYRSQPEKGLTEAIADALLAAGVTLPPQPAGPVTSEGAFYVYAGALHRRDETYCAPDEYSPADALTERHALDAAMPLLARDHGLLTPAEVERALSSFDWSYDKHPNPDEIMAALTRGAK